VKTLGSNWLMAFWSALADTGRPIPPVPGDARGEVRIQVVLERRVLQGSTQLLGLEPSRSTRGLQRQRAHRRGVRSRCAGAEEVRLGCPDPARRRCLKKVLFAPSIAARSGFSRTSGRFSEEGVG